jgi:hypothetical protein
MEAVFVCLSSIQLCMCLIKLLVSAINALLVACAANWAVYLAI